MVCAVRHGVNFGVPVTNLNSENSRASTPLVELNLFEESRDECGPTRAVDELLFKLLLCRLRGYNGFGT